MVGYAGIDIRRGSIHETICFSASPLNFILQVISQDQSLLYPHRITGPSQSLPHQYLNSCQPDTKYKLTSHRYFFLPGPILAPNVSHLPVFHEMVSYISNDHLRHRVIHVPLLLFAKLRSRVLGPLWPHSSDTLLDFFPCPIPAGVKKGTHVEAIIVRAILLSMVTGREGRHFVSVNAVAPKKPSDFLIHLLWR